jgi:hypothetical protein
VAIRKIEEKKRFSTDTFAKGGPGQNCDVSKTLQNPSGKVAVPQPIRLLASTKSKYRFLEKVNQSSGKGNLRVIRTHL